MMEQTVNRIHVGKPADFQTGPAIRGDEQTMQKHLALLEGMPGAQDLYSQLSSAIAAYHHPEQP
jgi:succinylglutamate desuccinylase